MLTNRDKEIIRALNKFRVMDRDSIGELFFAGLKNPKYAANNVLLRLMRDGQIKRSTAFVPYVYFGPDVDIKHNSAKIGHWLGILDVYKELLKLGELESFMVEPVYGRKDDGYARPDIYCYFRRTPFFVEVQKTRYSQRQIEEKLNRYAALFKSGVLTDQQTRVLILSDHRYAIEGDYPFRIFQAESFTQFVWSLKGQAAEKSATSGIKVMVK